MPPRGIPDPVPDLRARDLRAPDLRAPDLRALEARFDGPIPEHLLSGKTEAQLMADHHRAMIRFHDVRLADFTDALAKLEARPESDPAKAPWIASTAATLRFHRDQRARHETDLANLLRPPARAAE